MHTTRRNLDRALDALSALMPRLPAADDTAEVLRDIADEILDSAHLNDKTHVWSRLQCIQREQGLIPGDEDDACEGDEPNSSNEDIGGLV